jgi:hypothetical protein
MLGLDTTVSSLQASALYLSFLVNLVHPYDDSVDAMSRWMVSHLVATSPVAATGELARQLVEEGDDVPGARVHEEVEGVQLPPPTCRGTEGCKPGPLDTHLNLFSLNN